MSEVSPSQAEDRDQWLEILEHNEGFTDPDQWVDFARLHSFKKVRARKLSCCPDCGGEELTEIGQQIYYSTRMSLVKCKACQLIFVDTRIDTAVIRQHFEVAYKDDDYFLRARRQIFRQLVAYVGRRAPHGSKVLDIGGGKGHLLDMLAKARPDLDLTLNDISAVSCRYATEHFGIRSFCAALMETPSLGARFDVVMLIDVAYYEEDVQHLWQALHGLLDAGGVLVMRIPNKFLPLLLKERAIRIFGNERTKKFRTTISFFNPEHIYLFTRRYLRTRLRNAGFSSVRYLPTPALADEESSSFLLRAQYVAARIISALTFGRLITTPSMLVIARR